MKYITLIIGLLVAAGCGKTETQSLEEKVVGSYEKKFDEDTFKYVLLENGKWEYWVNGELRENGETQDKTWKIVGNEVHFGKWKAEWNVSFNSRASSLASKFLTA